MADVLALMIPIVAVGGFFAWMIALSPLGKAYAERFRGQTARSANPASMRTCSQSSSSSGTRWQNWPSA